MTALYNEIEPYPAQWMRNLINAGQLAPGVVDERSIKSLVAEDVRGATQAHFFAGIGCWSYALRLAGWPDDASVWTGSCPCQPFSSAGKKKGFADERHLWPEWFRLIRECRPGVIFGEQTASPDGLAWFDVVCADLEGAGYAIGAADICAAGIGAPHIRQRLYFVAYAGGVERGLCVRPGRSAGEVSETGGCGEADRVADADSFAGNQRRAFGAWSGHGGDAAFGRGFGCDGVDRDAGELGDPSSSSRSGWDSRAVSGAQTPGGGERFAAGRVADQSLVADAVGGFWADAEWIPCADGKSRPAEPGTFPLASGATARMGRLRATGNAIVPQVAATFIRAFIDVAAPLSMGLRAVHAR